MKTIRTAVQQRFADADSLGHINNVRMQEYFDLGKMDFYTQVLDSLLDWRRESLILVSIHTDIAAQMRLDDNLAVETWISKVGTKSMTVDQRLIDNADSTVKATCRSVVVAFDFAAQKSIPLPETWRTAVADYCA